MLNETERDIWVADGTSVPFTAHGESVRENGCAALAHSLRWLARDHTRGSLVNA
jgi:hypothetical protein